MATLRQVLPTEWQVYITQHCTNGGQPSLLDWNALDHCGKEVMKIVALAMQCHEQWPDVRPDLVRVACDQINAVCWG